MADHDDWRVWLEQHEEFPDVGVHDAAIVSLNDLEDGDTPPTVIGPETRVWAFATIGRSAQVGANCTIGQGVHVAPRVKIGNGCKLQNGAQLFEGVALEDDVFIGPHAVFTNVLAPRAFINRKAEFKPTLVKRGASIGANATILCGVTIGEYALVGAGAVVTHDVPPYTLVAGIPARAIDRVCTCGRGLIQQYSGTGGVGSFTCASCNAHYLSDGDTLKRQEVPPDAKATP